MSASRASATTDSPESLPASKRATLMLTKRTPGFWKAVREAVVKSLDRVPTPMTTSASRGEGVGGGRAGRADGAHRLRVPCGSEPLPAWVSPTGMPVASQNARSASSAPE